MTTMRSVDFKRILFIIVRILSMTVVTLSKALAGAVTFTVLAHFVPELREKLPVFYQLVDLTLQIIEQMTICVLGNICQIIH